MAQGFSDFIDACNTLMRSVPGISRVYDLAPDTATSNSGELPCVIPRMQRATGRYQAQNYLRKEFEAKFFVMVAPYAKNMASIENTLLALPDQIIEVFVKHVKLGDATNITHSGTGNIDDNLIEIDRSVITWGGVEYSGLEVRLSATVKYALVAEV